MKKNLPTILTIKDYGRIELHLKKYMELNGYNRSSLARSINTRFEVVDKWCNGTVEKIDADVLARMCYVLDCKVGDILVYVDDIDNADDMSDTDSPDSTNCKD